MGVTAVMRTSTSAASSGGDAVLTFTTSCVQTIRRRREVRERAGSGLSVVLAASVVPLLAIATLAVATLLT